jgi:uncharacterized protein (DUF305 family)
MAMPAVSKPPSDIWGWGVAVLACALALGVVASGAASLLHGWRAAPSPIPPPDAVDVGFARAMLQHHSQAVMLAQMMRDGRATGLDRLVRDIEATQLLELGQMQGWLALWRPPTATKPGMDWLLEAGVPLTPALSRYLLDCRRAATGMLGAPTTDELKRLQTLDGRPRDRLFLELMKRHHEGGLPMARVAAAYAGSAAVRELADRIVIEQSREIALIDRIRQVMAQMPAG